MENKYNINLINQYKNKELYIEDIFNVILSKADINELKETQYDIRYINNCYVKGNFEAFLYNISQYNEVIIAEMNNKIQQRWTNHLLKPLYFVKLNEKQYILESAGYEIFNNVQTYLKNVLEGKIERLTSTEEKFVIDWFFKETPSFYIQENNIDEINVLYEIFYNQKEYINKKNNKSAVNNFIGHHGIKKIMTLFTEEQRINLMDKTINYEEVITSYYTKLLRQKHFDLAEQLNDFDSEDIIKCLKNKVSDNPVQWFKPFLEKGSGISLSFMESKLALKARTFMDKEKTKIRVASYGAVKLLKKLHNHFDSQEVIKMIVCMIVESQNEVLYKELRSFVELPQDIDFQLYCSKAQIQKKSIEYIEKELLKNKLEEKLENKIKGKTIKI